MILLCLAVAILVVAYWQAMGATRFLPQVGPLLWLAVMYSAIQFGWLNFDNLEVRLIYLRLAIALLVVSIGLSVAIAWRRN